MRVAGKKRHPELVRIHAGREQPAAPGAVPHRSRITAFKHERAASVIYLQLKIPDRTARLNDKYSRAGSRFKNVGNVHETFRTSQNFDLHGIRTAAKPVRSSHGIQSALSSRNGNACITGAPDEKLQRIAGCLQALRSAIRRDSENSHFRRYSF